MKALTEPPVAAEVAMGGQGWNDRSVYFFVWTGRSRDRFGTWPKGPKQKPTEFALEEG